MLRETIASPPPRKRTTPGEHLLRAIATLGNSQATVLRHAEAPWASITFAGTRHALSLRFDGFAAVDAGEHFIAALADHEFHIPGHLVADAGIARVAHTQLPCPRIDVDIELLLLEAV